MKKVVGVVVGSLRDGSFSKSIADEIINQSSGNLEFKFIDISNLVIYNQDLDDPSRNPQEYEDFRKAVKEVDAYLFVTPEHNRSFPAALKNALDIGSRPYGSNVWNAKPGAVVSVSPGGIAGFGANHHLRQVLSFLNIYVMQQPEAYIGSVMNYLDENGKVNNEETKKHLKDFANAFENWVNKF